MKLLSVSLARSIWWCQSMDLNPRGRSLYPIIIPMLVELYDFKKYPAAADILDETKGIAFENGMFRLSDGEAIDVNLTFYNQGMMADTRDSTKSSDAFLEEILMRLSEAFKLPYHELSIRRKTYYSSLYISTPKSLELINPKLRQISKYLSNNVKGFENVHYEVGGISFWSDPIKVANPSNFGIERAVDLPFSENRYFSYGALETDKHLEVLNKLEGILST